MGGGLATRGLRTLFEAGAMGNLSDARLVERFVVGVDQDREDAFAALVGRHGPMVRGVCRRMLADSADADDAFQAVFLILARKAGSLRRAEGLKPWLHGVAVRVSKESRRRSERIQAREGGTLVDLPAPAVRDDLFELREAVDEELNRLPRRYREPLLLCELEGESRREAARRLGLAEGTLSSRLARGRALLRDRLTRRGLSAGSLLPLFPEIQTPALGPLGNASVRLALAFTTRGAVPAGLAALAEGVLRMLAASKLKSAVVASALVLCTVGLTAGLARGFGGGQDPQPAPATVAQKTKAERPVEARGVVVDEEGRPIAGAEVRLDPYSLNERLGVTDADGAFAIPAPGNTLDFKAILVRFDNDDGRNLGFFQYKTNLARQQAEAPVRIVADRTGGVFNVVVFNGPNPVAGATVEAVGRFTVLGQATTNEAGSALVYIPKNTRANWLVVRKDGVGYDYMELGAPGADGEPGPGEAGGNYSYLRVMGPLVPRTFRIRALKPDGSPASGVSFIARIRKEGHTGPRTSVLSNSRLQSATTDAEGVATFDWLPADALGVHIFAMSDRYSRGGIKVENGQEEATIRLVDLETIRGRVRLPYGSPAAGTLVSADGRDFGDTRSFSFQTRADDDGLYELKVEPNASYVITPASTDWRSPARFDVDVRPGEPVEGVDFQFAPGIVLRGTVTVGPDDQPAPGQFLQVAPLGRLQADSNRDPYRPLERSAFTDDRGRYEFQLARGDYVLTGPEKDQREEIALDGAPTVRDFHLDRLEMGSLRGIAIAGPEGRGVPEVAITLETTKPGLVGFTDDQGRFETRRPFRRMKVRARSFDGTLGGVAEVGPEENDITIQLTPMARAWGTLLGPDGQPVKGEEIPVGYWVEAADGRWLTFRQVGPRITTDDNGRFTLQDLVVFERREIGVIRNGKFLKAGEAYPEKPGWINLGTLQAQPLESGRPFP